MPYDDDEFTITRLTPCTLKYPYSTEENKMAGQRYTRMDRLREEARQLQERIARLERRPQEPEFEDDFPHVIWFQRDFGRGLKRYTYSAVKAAGRWYVSGRVEAMQCRTWEELMEWLYSSFDSGTSDYEPEIWVAVEWQQV